MYKFILTFLFSLFTVTSFAQFNVYARMLGIPNGKPQKLVIETTGEVYTFDKEGRLTSVSNGENEIRYSWNGQKIKFTAYQNGNKLGEDYMTVTTNTDREVSISLLEGDGTIKETYRENGSEDQFILSSNGQSMIETCYYNSEEDKYPYKVTQSFQGQTETLLMSGYEFDAKGNLVKRIIKNNGQSITEIRTISYYD